MNIDKDMLHALAAQDDKALSDTIRAIAAASGIDLGKMQFDAKTLRALRAAMRGANDTDLENAKRIFEGYNHGRK